MTIDDLADDPQVGAIFYTDEGKGRHRYRVIDAKPTQVRFAVGTSYGNYPDDVPMGESGYTLSRTDWAQAITANASVITFRNDWPDDYDATPADITGIDRVSEATLDDGI